MPEYDKRGSNTSGGCGCFGGGFTLGGIVAFILSWKTFHAIGWAILAAFFGWGYVGYWLIYYWK
jgi:hypothetical protein